MNAALIIFAKAPVPGLAKTRLIPALGADGAAMLAARMLERIAQTAADASAESLEICATPDAGHPVFQRLAQRHSLGLEIQGCGDLGERMQRAMQRALRVHKKVLLVGTDAPAMSASMLQTASENLDRCDAVFIPAMDGGYVLIGLRDAHAPLFSGMRWGTATVMEDTRARMRLAGLRWSELPPVADIDNPADLIHLPEDWRQ